MHADSDGAYGSPRASAELQAAGELVNRKRVARIMRERGIIGRHLRKRRTTTITDPAAGPVPDLLGRDFSAEAPGTKLVGDIT